MTDNIAKRVWDDLTVKQRGCDHTVWRGKYMAPEAICISCVITCEQYDRHKEETKPVPNTPFWRWQPQYERKMGIESDYDHRPMI